MTYWHEEPKNDNGWLFPARPGGRVAVSFRGHDVRRTPFQGHFLRYEGTGEIPAKLFHPRREKPEGWFELWPVEPMFASSMEEAKALFQPLLPQIEDGSLDALFERKPYQPPPLPQRIKEIEHPTHVAKAIIAQHASGLYQVGYTVYAPNGRYFPASTPSISTDRDFEWGRVSAKDEAGRKVLTMADDLANAEEIAVIELEAFVARDPEIQRRERLPE